VSRWLLNSIACLLCWGIWSFMPKLAVQHVPPKSAFFFQGLGGVLVAIAIFSTMQERVVFNAKGLGFALVGGLAGYAGMLFFLYAVQSGKVCVVAPLTALYPVIAIVLGITFLGESLTGLQWVGVVLALTGIVLISCKG